MFASYGCVVRSEMIVCEILRATLREPGQFDILHYIVLLPVRSLLLLLWACGVVGFYYGAAGIYWF